MTRDEHVKLVEVGDSFYDKLARLAAEHIAQMPRIMKHETIEYLQERCSIYGSSYKDYLSDARYEEWKGRR